MSEPLIPGAVASPDPAGPSAPPGGNPVGTLEADGAQAESSLQGAAGAEIYWQAWLPPGTPNASSGLAPAKPLMRLCEPNPDAEFPLFTDF